MSSISDVSVDDVTISFSDDSYFASGESLEAIQAQDTRAQTEAKGYQESYLRIMRETDQVLSQNPVRTVGELAKAADAKYLKDGRTWTPSEKTRAWVIVGLVLGVFIDIGLAALAFQAGASALTLVAIPVTFLIIGGIYYLNTRVDLDRISDRMAVQTALSTMSLKKVLDKFTIEQIIGYDLLNRCVPVSMTMPQFYGQFERLARAVEQVTAKNGRFQAAINKVYDERVRPWQNVKQMATTELYRRRSENYHERRIRQENERLYGRTERTNGEKTFDLFKSGVNVLAEWQLQSTINEANREIQKLELVRSNRLQVPQQQYQKAIRVLDDEYERVRNGHLTTSTAFKNLSAAYGKQETRQVPAVRPVNVNVYMTPPPPPSYEAATKADTVPSYAEAMRGSVPSAPVLGG